MAHVLAAKCVTFFYRIYNWHALIEWHVACTRVRQLSAPLRGNMQNVAWLPNTVRHVNDVAAAAEANIRYIVITFGRFFLRGSNAFRSFFVSVEICKLYL